MKNFTAKTARICVKNGFTPEMVCEKYECTEEELKIRLSQVFKDEENAREVFSQLEANRKKPHGFHRAYKKKKQQQIVDVIPYVDMPSTSEEPEPVPPVEPKKLTKSEILASIKKEEEAKSQELILFEADTNVLQGKRRALKNSFEEDKRNIEQFKKQLFAYKDKCRQKAEAVDEIVAELKKRSSLHREKTIELAALRAKIDEMSTVIICVDNDGNIEAPDDEVVLNDEGYEALISGIFETIKDNSEIDLKMSEIRTLARILKIVERIERFNLIFDNETMESIFWSIKGKE